MPAGSQIRWTLPSEGYPPEWVAVGRDWGVPDPVLDALWNRGLRTPSEIERFLAPSIENLLDPFLLADAGRAVARVWSAITAGEPIVVFGDYDVDGITAAALWTRCLRRFGAQVVPVVPNRMEDGFGLSLRAVETARAGGAGLLITNDCGTSSHEAIARAGELGLDVVVSDHHVPDPELPPAYALVNPRRSDDRYPFPDLAAVGVAFKILQGLFQQHATEEDRRFLLNQLDLVALGTIADVVPLTEENRILVHYGVRILRVRRRPAFEALIAQAGLGDRFLETSHLAFSLVPRINAAGRLGVPGRALDLLLADDPAEARGLAERLESDNLERRRLNEQVEEEALRAVDPAAEGFGRQAIVLGSEGWHPGVLGITASRLAERFRVPVFLVSLSGDPGRGSARTPRGVDLLGLLAGSAEHLVGFGGHRQAAGFSIAPAEFARFQRKLIEFSRAVLSAPEEETLELDGALEPQRCDLPLARWIERLGPFGEGNPEPIFQGEAFCRGVKVLKERHLRMQALCGGRRIDCIGFGLGGLAPQIPAGGGSIRLAFTPSLNRYRGQEKVQLKLRAIDLV
jgi:single-stranded-DNA-specific exonuclease